ncbi:hypothetical protein WJX81_008179 [Elliptochloris bilobata]|uniref:G-patch domain-containing protein n=1 Tax=Elliptochloris bilobata TaxID=381761 RepID=A0AAW1RAP4_9CHLO
MQRQQITALAGLYGYEGRACGRRGLTLFRTEHSQAALPPDAQQKADRLVACSAAGGRPSADLRAALAAARGVGGGLQSALGRPVAPDSRGATMLRALGWEAGAGLGRSAQGRTEPVPLHLGQGRRGLGS